MGEEYKMEENKVEENKTEEKTEKTFKELYLAGEIGSRGNIQFYS